MGSRDYFQVKVIGQKLLFVAILLCSAAAFSQKIFRVGFANQADFRIYEVKFENQADLKVFKVDFPNEARGCGGLWYEVEFSNQADWRVFEVDFPNRADLKVFYVKFRNQAGWISDNKKEQFCNNITSN